MYSMYHKALSVGWFVAHASITPGGASRGSRGSTSSGPSFPGLGGEREHGAFFRFNRQGMNLRANQSRYSQRWRRIYCFLVVALVGRFLSPADPCLPSMVRFLSPSGLALRCGARATRQTVQGETGKGPARAACDQTAELCHFPRAFAGEDGRGGRRCFFSELCLLPPPPPPLLPSAPLEPYAAGPEGAKHLAKETE